MLKALTLSAAAISFVLGGLLVLQPMSAEAKGFGHRAAVAAPAPAPVVAGWRGHWQAKMARKCARYAARGWHKRKCAPYAGATAHYGAYAPAYRPVR